ELLLKLLETVGFLGATREFPQLPIEIDDACARPSFTHPFCPHLPEGGARLIRLAPQRIGRLDLPAQLRDLLDGGLDLVGEFVVSSLQTVGEPRVSFGEKLIEAVECEGNPALIAAF